MGKEWRKNVTWSHFEHHPVSWDNDGNHSFRATRKKTSQHTAQESHEKETKSSRDSHRVPDRRGEFSVLIVPCTFVVYNATAVVPCDCASTDICRQEFSSLCSTFPGKWGRTTRWSKDKWNAKLLLLTIWNLETQNLEAAHFRQHKGKRELSRNIIIYMAANFEKIPCSWWRWWSHLPSMLGWWMFTGRRWRRRTMLLRCQNVSQQEPFLKSSVGNCLWNADDSKEEDDEHDGKFDVHVCTYRFLLTNILMSFIYTFTNDVDVVMIVSDTRQFPFCHTWMNTIV